MIRRKLWAIETKDVDRSWDIDLYQTHISLSLRDAKAYALWLVKFDGYKRKDLRIVSFIRQTRKKK